MKKLLTLALCLILTGCSLEVNPVILKESVSAPSAIRDAYAAWTVEGMPYPDQECHKRIVIINGTSEAIYKEACSIAALNEEACLIPRGTDGWAVFLPPGMSTRNYWVAHASAHIFNYCAAEQPHNEAKAHNYKNLDKNHEDSEIWGHKNSVEASLQKFIKAGSLLTDDTQGDVEDE